MRRECYRKQTSYALIAAMLLKTQWLDGMPQVAAPSHIPPIGYHIRAGGGAKQVVPGSLEEV